MGMGNETQKLVAEALKKERCHSIHMLGDLIYPSGIKSVNDIELQEKFLKYYLPITEEGHNPSLNLILGNHDHEGNPKAWEEVAKKYPKINYPSPYYLQNWSGLCLAHLESDYYQLLTDFFRAQGQQNWLTDQQKELKEKCAVTVALTHHPYKSQGPHHGNAKGRMKRFHEKYIIGKFDYLVSGHEHILSDEGTIDGTHLYISGAGGNFTEGEDVGFLVFEVSREMGKMKKLKPYFRRVTNRKDLSSHQTSSSLKDSF